MAGDSVATFSERIMELGLSEHVDRFIRAGWFTLSNLAYASRAGQTGNRDDFVREVLVKGLGEEGGNHRHAPVLERLYYEAFMLAAQDLRARTEPTSSATPRQLPQPERRERRRRIQQRLVGLNLRGELEASHHLVDLCINMYDNDAVEYVPLELCTKRDMEVQRVAKDPFFATSLGQDGTLRLNKVSEGLVSVPDCQYAMSFAYQRRGTALEQADVMQYETHEALHQRLVHALMKPSEPGFARISPDQLIAADRKAWSLLAEETRDGIKRLGSLGRPCDIAMKTVLSHTEFIMALMPRQIPTSGLRNVQPQLALLDAPAAAPAAGPGKPGKKNKGKKRAAKQEEERARKISNAFSQKNSAAPARPSKEAKAPRGDFVKLPAALIGMCPKSDSGKRLCFAFNLGTCNAASPGQECAKGWHLCMKPTASGQACSKPHAANRCTS